MTEYFTETEILETIKNNIDGYEGIEDYTFDDVFNDLFNSDYYIIGYAEAEEALKEYGIFNALDEVQRWDEETYGHWYTDYTNSEAVANTLEYIKAHDVFESILDNAPALIDWDSETNSKNIKAFKEALNEGLISEERINESVEKILSLKDSTIKNNYNEYLDVSYLNSSEHQDIINSIYSKSNS